MRKTLRPYQAEALRRASDASASHSSILIVQPTGTGKTLLAVEACRRHAALGGVPLFVAPRRELVAQASRALKEHGLEPGHDLFVRTIQELVMPGASIPPGITMVVFDEARHYVADQWSRVHKALPDAIFLGLDATPERADGRGLGDMFEVLVEAISIHDAVEQGYLVPCDTIRPKHALAPGELAQDPVDAYLEHARGLSCVVFAPSIQLAQSYATRLNEAAPEHRAAAVWGDMPTRDRDNALTLYEEGKLSVLVNVNLLTEGWDSPRTEVVMLARSFGTQGQMLQAAGRGMRPHLSKSKMILLDLTGCTHTLGDVDEPRTWHLEGKAARRAKDGAEVRFCPVCGAPTESAECVQCGYKGELRKRKPRVLGLPMDRFARERALPEEQQIKALAGYMRAGRTRGYRRFWAIKCWEHKFGRPVTRELEQAALRLL